MDDQRDRTFFALFGLLTALYLATFGYYMGPSAIKVPVYDLLGWVMHYADTWATGRWWAYLWMPHNEHRLVWSRLLLLVDIGWFHGSTLPFAVFSLACLAATIGALVHAVMTSDLPAGLRPALAMAVVLLLAATYIEVDCSVPAFGNELHTAAFFVLSLVLLDGRGVQGPFAVLRRVAAMISAGLAAFGTAGGLVALPILLWSTWRAGLGSRWLLAIGIAAVLLTAVYVPGLTSHYLPVSFDSGALLAMLDYAIRFLGLPWSHVHSLVWIGRLVGLALLLSGAGLVLLRGLRAQPDWRPERIGIGLLLFALAMAALAAMGRFEVAPNREMPIRYGICVALGQVGLLLVLSPQLARIWTGPQRRILQGAALAAGVLLLAQQIAAGKAAAEVARQYTQSFRRFASGEWTPDMNHYVFPSREGAVRGLAIVRALNIYQN